MSDNTKIENPSPALEDGALDEVYGGYSRVGHRAKCRRCRDEFPESSLFGGYCENCLNALDKMGVHPSL